MIRGKIIGQVWGARQVPGLDGRKLVLVAARDAAQAPTGQVVVAIDTLGRCAAARTSPWRSARARATCCAPGPTIATCCCDAAIAALVEGAE